MSSKSTGPTLPLAQAMHGRSLRVLKRKRVPLLEPRASFQEKREAKVPIQHWPRIPGSHPPNWEEQTPRQALWSQPSINSPHCNEPWLRHSNTSKNERHNHLSLLFLMKNSHNQRWMVRSRRSQITGLQCLQFLGQRPPHLEPAWKEPRRVP